MANVGFSIKAVVATTLMLTATAVLAPAKQQKGTRTVTIPITVQIQTYTSFSPTGSISLNIPFSAIQSQAHLVSTARYLSKVQTNTPIRLCANASVSLTNVQLRKTQTVLGAVTLTQGANTSTTSGPVVGIDLAPGDYETSEAGVWITVAVDRTWKATDNPGAYVGAVNLTVQPNP